MSSNGTNHISKADSKNRNDKTKPILYINKMLDEMMVVVETMDYKLLPRGSCHLQENLFYAPHLKNEKSKLLAAVRKEFRPTIFSESEARDLFEKILNPTDPELKAINWNLEDFNCGPRALQLGKWLSAHGIKYEDVKLESPMTPQKPWPFHVAVAITIQDLPSERPRKLIIDPAVSKKLLSPSEWIDLFDPGPEPVESHFFALYENTHGGRLLTFTPGQFDDTFFEGSNCMTKNRILIERVVEDMKGNRK